jgi:hypothetical protein
MRFFFPEGSLQETRAEVRGMRLLDICCGRWGASKGFLRKGWYSVGIDLTQPPEIPENCEFWQLDILKVSIVNGYFYIDRRPDQLNAWVRCDHFDFIWASTPCEEFSVHGMKHFHPHPKYPEMGIKLFNHTRALCEASGVPFVIENVRAAQQFVGNAVHHCGPFYLWGNAVPPLLHRGITKGTHDIKGVPVNQSRRFYFDKKAGKNRMVTERAAWKENSSGSKERREATAELATIPIELANCVADYAERICFEEKVLG